MKGAIMDPAAELHPDELDLLDHAADLDFARHAGRRFVTIDLENLAEERVSVEAEQRIKGWLSGMATSNDPVRFKALFYAAISLATKKAPWRGPEVRSMPISTHQAIEPYYRRATRVLAMVHELHKAGYQRIRVLPAVSPNGGFWRAYVTFAGNIAADGFNIVDEDLEDRRKIVARYSTGQENEYFGWTDAGSCNARQLAQLFIERFPIIAKQGEGGDWAYAGWLTDVLGHAEAGPERGGLVHLLQDWDPDPAYTKRWRPPPPLSSSDTPWSL